MLQAVYSMFFLAWRYDSLAIEILVGVGAELNFPLSFVEVFLDR